MNGTRIALLVCDFEDGGVERNFTSLAAGLAELGIAIDLLVGAPEHPYLAELGDEVRILSTRDDPERRLADYLSTSRPALILTGKLKDDALALAVKQRLGLRLAVVAAVGTLLSGRFASHRFNPFKTWRETRRIGRLYRRLDGITAVSEQVARDLGETFGISGVPLRVLANPIIPSDLETRAALPCAHPWLAPGQPSVIIAVGGLRKVKDYPTLIRAFARLSRARDARLLILGEGKERARLTHLAKRLGIDERLDLHGFVPDPFGHLARARVLALSSRREGLPNVLVEALALGVPVVATDCTEGVRTLLRAGEIGSLVAVGDDRALARALSQALDAVPDPSRLREAARPFARDMSARAYAGFFLEIIAGLEKAPVAPRI